MSSLGGVEEALSVNQSFFSKNMNNLTQCKQVDTSARIFFILPHSLVFLVGLFLNGLTLKVYFCHAQQQTSSSVTVYLKNLAAADFLLTLCLPIRIINYASSSALIRRAYCSFGASALYLNMYASILFMGYIAANRYQKIVHHLGSNILQTVKAAHIISTVTWTVLVAMMFTYVLMSLLTPEQLQGYSSVPITASCDSLHSQPLSVLYKALHSCCAAIFLLVLITLVFFYYSTSHRLSLAEQRHPASSCSKKLVKSRRNMLVLVSVFCICFVPYHLVRLPYVLLKGQCSMNQLFFYLKELAIMMSVLNVCLDPLIYFIFSKAFRAQLSMRRMFSSAKTDTRGTKSKRRSSDRRMNTTRVNKELISVMIKENSGL
ncbi:P2Y purinoceptor 14-like [Echeneis naucrates]|uniref:P2Y purinoceptor 14-like n=1 Tax=Echeneis naucrates TaxID=173247 RepID=A0A665U7R5_ECHNA|nr:P2Y purinoceptor 14-like [Echeneis naucrates]XP_029373801.1 P2Y purinoceptor 14-like [Echeneis naucrates]XP_029373802.1 P2Y purinoceptor 14-like [Echeneis naucrates]